MKTIAVSARWLGRAAAIIGLLYLLALPAAGQTPFFQGKTITLVQSSDAGDTSDTMVRAALPTLRKHIPGEPVIKLQFMPGGGGTKAANYIFNNAKPDGLTIGRIGGGLVANAALSAPGVMYDLNKLIYLGSAHSTYHWLFITRAAANVKSFEALRSTPGLRIGSQAVGHSNYFVGRLFAWLMGLREPKFNVGYSGNEQDIALARGELDARINNADTLTRRNTHMLAQGLIDIHAIMEVPRGLKKAGFENLPEIESFAKTTRERQLLQMVRSFRQVGSPYIMPPGSPDEAVKILQEAMRKVFKDPDFHKDYLKLVGEEPTPITADEMEKLIRELPRDPEIVALFKKINEAGPLPPR
jgi:tripartite-type tricarboxylate transporter receptor subunit TctC